MRRTTSAADADSETSTELIDRIAAERHTGVARTGRHRHPAGRAEAVVSTTPVRTGSLAKRLAPLATGAVVMLVATTVATLAQPDDPETRAAAELANAAASTQPSTAEASPEAPPTAPAAAAAGDEGKAEQQAEAEQEKAAQEKAAQDEAEKKAEQEADAKAEAQAEEEQAEEEQAESATTRSSSGGEGRQAADVHGWTHVGGDEFSGGKSEKWTEYDGPGHNGEGRRTPEAISVENGKLVIRGDSEGNTGGMSWKEDQRFGRWEMRARFPAGDDQYHPVLILWPDEGDSGDGEIDFAETTSASDKVSFFLHYGDDQEYAHKNIDITQWHNYAVEWVDGRVTGYIDGEKWFESTEEETLPPGKVHPTIQLDYFPEGGSPEPTELQVDYLRIYN